MARREQFDYRQMANDAERECGALRKILERRKRNPPETAEEELCWKRENSILYTMYLEQRANQQLFTHRAQLREQP